MGKHLYVIDILLLYSYAIIIIIIIVVVVIITPLEITFTEFRYLAESRAL